VHRRERLHRRLAADRPAQRRLSANFTVYTRSDNGAQQLAYKGHPLYMYAGDGAAGQTNGNGIVSFGGTWSVARP
jgi:predicted lipoprotein with Yx(FWY)xxD motif